MFHFNKGRIRNLTTGEESDLIPGTGQFTFSEPAITDSPINFSPDGLSFQIHGQAVGVLSILGGYFIVFYTPEQERYMRRRVWRDGWRKRR